MKKITFGIKSPLIRLLLASDGYTFYDMRLANETCRLDMEKAMARVMDRSWYILGEELEMFEQEFAAFCGISHCVGVNSGTDASMVSSCSCRLRTWR